MWYQSSGRKGSISALAQLNAFIIKVIAAAKKCKKITQDSLQASLKEANPPEQAVLPKEIVQQFGKIWQHKLWM